MQRHTLLSASHDPKRKGFGRWRLLGPDGKLGYSSADVETAINATYPNAGFQTLERHESSLIFSVRKRFGRSVREKFLERLHGKEGAKQ